MLTIEKLTAYGADVGTGLKRCVNKESLYLRLVKTVPSSADFARLQETVAAGDYEAGFQAAHGLKGVTANLSLTPLSGPIMEITEHLRAGDVMDYQPLLHEIEQKRAELAELCQD
ncbi:MAG: Hpt domain-containing protein [Oscillospiraceae bacterium]|nr:Hpt domain-containing protein [Oscillospiraceae bacterium]